ncbi:DUF1963 domain-containing protein [Mycoplasma sp. P36-A1]|uniref:DUF1963 domain-containing protein n=1 Tax=Mycoplasma sp. P36-A1 TaxID=3252900 RepID=UPI003C2CBC70
MEDVISRIYKKLNSSKETFLLLESNDIPLIWESKFGGMPYMLEKDMYPVTLDEGEPYEFLLQINFADLPKNDLFPSTGLIQFFLNHNYNYDKEDKPFIVKYIDNIEYDEKKIDFDIDDEYEINDFESDLEQEEDEDENDHMIDEEYKIIFEKALDEVNPSSLEWKSFSLQLSKQLEPFKNKLEDYDKVVSSDGYIRDLSFIFENEDVEEVMYANKLLGYPANPGKDIRFINKKYQDYILLLQLNPDTEAYDNDDEISIEWFIHPNDLKNKNFDNVICSYFYDIDKI